MVNYSITTMGNPAKPAEPKRIYGVSQYTEKMTLEEFSEHISEHNNVYDAEDVQAILGKAMKCLREMLIAGKKVELGKLGDFSLSLQGKGCALDEKFNPDIHVEKVNVIWTPSPLFTNLKKEVTFNLVASRDEQKAAIKKAKEDAAKGGTPTKGDDAGGSTANPGGSSSGGSGSQGSGSTSPGSSGSDGDNTVE